MMPIAITTAEMLEAIAAATSYSSAPEHARTTVELAEETKLGRKVVTAALRAIHAAGRLEVHYVMRRGFDGKNKPVPAYTIKPSPKGKRSR